ncbi:MAG: SH3 domain-containing protein [Bacteroidia bacterium]
MKNITITLFMLLALVACQKGSEKAAETTAAETTAETTAAETTAEAAAPKVDSAVAKPAPVITSYVAVVNDLRLRETPKLDGKVLATLKQGDKMTGTGNVSTEKVTVDLRGQKLTDVFYEVTAANGVKGWAFAGAVAAEGTSAADANKDVWLVTKTSVGGITKKTTQADLEKLFGKNNLTQEKELYVNADVPPFQGVTVFKGKADELEVFWEEGKKGKVISFVIVSGNKGQWHTAEGLKAGMNLNEFVKLNAKPIAFSGFGWDYGGYINDLKKGKLESTGLSFRLGYKGDNMPDGLSGDVTCKSDDPKVAKVANNIYVAEITSHL